MHGIRLAGTPRAIHQVPVSARRSVRSRRRRSRALRWRGCWGVPALSQGTDDRLVLVDIRQPRIERPISIAWNDATASPAIRAFLALVHEYFEDEAASVTPLRRTTETVAIPG